MIDDTNRNTALASALVDELARCGVRQAVASPGSRSSPVVLALDREPAIDLRIVLDERCAGFLALGAALASGRPIAVACTSGSAAANLMPAVVEAGQAGVPLILLTSDRPPELRGIGAGQTIDQIKLYGDAAAWFCEVGTHDADDDGLLHYRSLACRAVAEAAALRGPTHLNLAWRDPLGPEARPEDVSASRTLAREGRPDRRPLTAAAAGRKPDEGLLTPTADRLARTSRPLIVAGRLLDPELASSIVELAAKLDAPILADPLSQLRHGGHDRTGVVAAYDLILREPVPELAPGLILRFGDLPTSKPLRRWLADLPEGEQVVVDPPGRWNEPTRTASALVRADARSFSRALTGRAGGAAEPEWRRAWVAAEREAQGAIDQVLDAAPGLSEPALLRALSPVLGDNERVLLASSMPIRDAEAFLRGGETAARFHANRGANGIDGLVSTAAGLALGAGAATWAVLGDLALAHDLGGLATLTAAEAPIRLLILDNGGGHIFDFLPQAGQIEPDRFERLFLTPSSLDLRRVAELFGLAYVPVEKAADLEAARAHPRALLHARIDPEPNVALHRRIAEAVSERLRA